MTTNSRDEEYDALLVAIADYVCGDDSFSQLARNTARLSMIDALGCGLLALRSPECTKLLGPVVPGAELAQGVPVPGTSYRLDPVTAAFDIGTCIRWLDYNDTWLAAEWGHPSDNLGAILAAAAYASATATKRGSQPLIVGDVLTAMVQAHEIQGVLALGHAFNRRGLDHVLLVRIASAAVATRLLGGDRVQVMDAVSHAFVDGAALRIYRHAPNVGSRKSWAAGDATSRGVRLALMVLSGEMGYQRAVTTPQWGFQAVVMGGQPLDLPQPLASYVMENVLFKVSAPAEFHAQTALEAAVGLHPLVADRLSEVERVDLTTHEAALRIISKTGPLRNPADRDHCLQYIVAVGLTRGTLTADDYEDAAASDPILDALRERMVVTEDPQWSTDYLDPEKRSISNAVQVRFTDGTTTPRVAVEYPLGHQKRREEALPHLRAKLERNLRSTFPSRRAEELSSTLLDDEGLESMPVPLFLDLLAT